MTEALIAILVPITLLACAFALFGRKNDVKRHIVAINRASIDRDAPNALVSKIVNEADRSKLQQRFVEAGWYKTTVQSYYAWVFGCIGICALLAVAALFYFKAFTTLYIALAVLVGLSGSTLPSLYLDRAIKARKTAVQRTLPNLLDMVSTTVEAGIALNGALSMALDAIHGPLADELREVLADVRIGQSRTDALTAMANRVKQIDLTSTVMAMVQTEKLGGNIGKVLDELALEARHRRLMHAEELAAQLPVKMVIPMALFMLPALFVMIFGPVVSDLMRTFK